MAFSIESQLTPLSINDEGVVRIGGTRVTLETVIGSYKDGVSAEEIVNRYPSLKLADVYAAIAYYLSHLAEVNAYLDERERRSEEARREEEARHPEHRGLRERLLARRHK